MAWSPFGKPQKQLRSRAAERHDAHGLRCPLGDLADLSTSGMRVVGKGKCTLAVGQVVPMVISNGGQAVRVQGQVAWVKRPVMGSGAFQVGLRFMDVRPGLTAALDQLAKFGCVNTAGFGAVADEPVAATAAPQPAARVEVEDLYALLGVERTASESEIRKAFHALAMKFHPDRNTGDGAAEKFESINKCYLVLKDSEKRRKYDELLRRSA